MPFSIHMNILVNLLITVLIGLSIYHYTSAFSGTEMGIWTRLITSKIRLKKQLNDWYGCMMSLLGHLPQASLNYPYSLHLPSYFQLSAPRLHVLRYINTGIVGNVKTVIVVKSIVPFPAAHTAQRNRCQVYCPHVIPIGCVK